MVLLNCDLLRSSGGRLPVVQTTGFGSLLFSDAPQMLVRTEEQLAVAGHYGRIGRFAK